MGLVIYSSETFDKVTICFYCGKAIGNWTDNDDPWTEHAKWSRKCSYLLLSKGRKFVDKSRELKAVI